MVLAFIVVVFEFGFVVYVLCRDIGVTKREPTQYWEPSILEAMKFLCYSRMTTVQVDFVVKEERRA